MKDAGLQLSEERPAQAKLRLLKRTLAVVKQKRDILENGSYG
ncbi:hypothetical protein [Candidatus Flexifilum breve]